MLKNITLIIALLLTSLAQAQKETSTRHIDILAYNSNGKLYFYTQKQKDKFLELEFDTQEDENLDLDTDTEVYDLKLVYYNEEDLETLSEIKEDDNKIIYLKDIQHTTPSDFVGKTFNTLPPIYDEDTQTIVKILNPHLVLLCDIDTEEENPYQRTDYYSLHTIHLKKGRNIYLLSDGGNIEGFMVPLKDKTLFLTNRETTVLAPTQYPSSYKDNFIDYKPEKHLIVCPKGKRYELMNTYKEKVLSGRYDTIYYNKFGIIARRGSKFTLYDSYLQKKAFKQMRSAYFYRNGIEMLNNQGAAYYTISGERIKKFPKISYSLCGTVYESRYSLKKDPKKSEHPHYMLYGFGGPASDFEAEKRNYLSDRSADETLSFIDGSRYFEWDDNDFFTDSIYPYPELIRVQQGNKYGLFKYNYQKISEKELYIEGIEEDKENEEENSYKRNVRKYASAHLTGEEQLPIIYDNIQQHKDGLIYFYKDNKIGIYPQHKKVLYDKIEPQTSSFYQIVKKGKKGYLDIRTMKEYF
mgnify:FL=1|jgi:hypothetical protein